MYRRIIRKIKRTSERLEWKQINYNPEIGYLSLTKDNQRLEVYATSPCCINIVSYIKHPHKGHTRLVRKGLKFPEVRNVLENVRNHTNKGRYLE